MDKTRVSIPNLLSAAAVVAGLIFVGYEISQNTQAQQSATLEGIANQRIELNLTAMTDDRLLGLIARMRVGEVGTDFTPVETQAARFFLINYLRIIEGAYRQVALRVIGRDDLRTLFSSNIFSWAFLRDQWPSLQVSFEPGFIELIEVEFLR